MYLCSSALIFYIDSYFSLGHMSMDMSRVLAALSFCRVPSVTATNIQVASPQGCTPRLASPEHSGTFIQPGQHLHANRNTRRARAHTAALISTRNVEFCIL